MSVDTGQESARGFTRRRQCWRGPCCVDCWQSPVRASKAGLIGVNVRLSFVYTG